jgi:hypothetical protein
MDECLDSLWGPWAGTTGELSFERGGGRLFYSLEGRLHANTIQWDVFVLDRDSSRQANELWSSEDGGTKRLRVYQEVEAGTGVGNCCAG